MGSDSLSFSPIVCEGKCPRQFAEADVQVLCFHFVGPKYSVFDKKCLSPRGELICQLTVALGLFDGCFHVNVSRLSSTGKTMTSRQRQKCSSVSHATTCWFLCLLSCVVAGVLHHREHAAAVEAGYKRLKGSPHGPGQIKVIKITRTYAVPYPVPVPYTKEIPFPVPFEKAVPVAVPHPFPVPIPRPVHVPQPYIVPITSHGDNLFEPHHSNQHSFHQNYQTHNGLDDYSYFDHSFQHPGNPSYQDVSSHHEVGSSSENSGQPDYPSYDDQDSYFPSGHSYSQPYPSEIEITTKSPIRYSQPDPGFALPLEHQYPFSEVYHQQTHLKQDPCY